MPDIEDIWDDDEDRQNSAPLSGDGAARAELIAQLDRSGIVQAMAHDKNLDAIILACGGDMRRLAARIAELEAERDRARSEHRALADLYEVTLPEAREERDRWQTRATKAEAREARLRKALKELEAANETLAAKRPKTAYDALIEAGQGYDLMVLDIARKAARTALLSQPAQGAGIVRELAEAMVGLSKRVDDHFGGPDDARDWREQVHARAVLAKARSACLLTEEPQP